MDRFCPAKACLNLIWPPILPDVSSCEQTDWVLSNRVRVNDHTAV